MATSKYQRRSLADLPRSQQRAIYEREARAYQKSLPPEHYMEATAQATQRAITLASLALIAARRRDVHVFNELLVQYPLQGRKPGQVVPDNMVVITDQPIEATGSYNLSLEPAGPFFVLEYVSRSNPRKDYEDNFRHYEQHLKVPYYLVFRPDTQDLRLFHPDGEHYVPVQPNQYNRYPIPELDLEVALLDGWVRFWYKGELLPLPAEMQEQLQDAIRKAAAEKRRADKEKQRADEEKQRADALAAELGALRRKNGKA